MDYFPWLLDTCHNLSVFVFVRNRLSERSDTFLVESDDHRGCGFEPYLSMIFTRHSLILLGTNPSCNILWRLHSTCLISRLRLSLLTLISSVKNSPLRVMPVSSRNPTHTLLYWDTIDSIYNYSLRLVYLTLLQ